MDIVIAESRMPLVIIPTVARMLTRTHLEAEA